MKKEKEDVKGRQRKICGSLDKDPDRCKNVQSSRLSFKLKVAFTNADGIGNELPELHLYLESFKPDILAIVESNCNVHLPNALLSTHGFQIHRQDNLEERRGGILAFVNDGLEMKTCHEIDDYASQFKESCWVWIKVSRTTRMPLGIVYRKPNSC